MKFEMPAWVHFASRVIADVDPAATVAASPLSFGPDGHVTVFHAPSHRAIIDLAIDAAGLRRERIDDQRVRVRNHV